MKQLIALTSFFFLTQRCAAQSAVAEQVWPAAEISSYAHHNAFTDLLEYKGYVYCSFREGSRHVPGSNGVGRILRTRDGNTWEHFATLHKEGIDLRDQKLSVMPDGRMLCLMGGSVYDTTQKPSKLQGMYPQVSFMDAGMKFTAPENAVIENAGNNWIWRLTWYRGTGYGIDYGNGTKALLVKTTDGKTFKKVAELNVDGAPNEATIRFDTRGKMYILVRREQGDKMGVLATGTAPFTSFNYQKLEYRVGGPDFIFSPDGQRLFIGTRLYLPAGEKTGIRITDLNGKLIKTITLESGGDCSYPGLLIKNKQLWVSYYSSHTGKTAIYFTKIPLNDLLR